MTSSSRRSPSTPMRKLRVEVSNFRKALFPFYDEISLVPATQGNSNIKERDYSYQNVNADFRLVYVRDGYKRRRDRIAISLAFIYVGVDEAVFEFSIKNHLTDDFFTSQLLVINEARQLLNKLTLLIDSSGLDSSFSRENEELFAERLKRFVKNPESLEALTGTNLDEVKENYENKAQSITEKINEAFSRLKLSKRAQIKATKKVNDALELSREHYVYKQAQQALKEAERDLEAKRLSLSKQFGLTAANFDVEKTLAKTEAEVVELSQLQGSIFKGLHPSLSSNCKYQPVGLKKLKQKIRDIVWCGKVD